MGNYSIAASKNCTRELGHVVNIEIVNAIQRTAAKTWVSEQLYDHDMCTLDFSVLLVDVPNLHAAKYIEALQWWVKILDLKDDRSKKINAAIALTLYNSYHELPSFWKIREPMSSEDIHKSISNILWYDGPTRVCSGDTKEHQESNSSNIWRQYLGPKSDAVIAS